MMDTKGPALDEANRTVRNTSARLLRLLRDPNRSTGEVYALQDSLGHAVHQLTTSLVATLISMGYKAYIPSDSDYFMLDECVQVVLDNEDLGLRYEIIVWSFSKPRPEVRIVSAIRQPIAGVPEYYDYCLPSLAIYQGAGVRLGTMQELMDCLGEITATINTYRQCTGCYWSADSYSFYCGLGKVPTQVCTDRQLTTGG